MNRGSAPYKKRGSEYFGLVGSYMTRRISTANWTPSWINFRTVTSRTTPATSKERSVPTTRTMTVSWNVMVFDKLVDRTLWVSRDGHTQHQIDHVCISRSRRLRLLEVWNKRSAEIVSDHHLLIGEIHLRIAWIRRRQRRLQLWKDRSLKNMIL